MPERRQWADGRDLSACRPGAWSPATTSTGSNCPPWPGGWMPRSWSASSTSTCRCFTWSIASLPRHSPRARTSRLRRTKRTRSISATAWARPSAAARRRLPQHAVQCAGADGAEYVPAMRTRHPSFSRGSLLREMAQKPPSCWNATPVLKGLGLRQPSAALRVLNQLGVTRGTLVHGEHDPQPASMPHALKQQHQVKHKEQTIVTSRLNMYRFIPVLLQQSGKDRPASWSFHQLSCQSPR